MLLVNVNVNKDQFCILFLWCSINCLVTSTLIRTYPVGRHALLKTQITEAIILMDGFSCNSAEVFSLRTVYFSSL